MTVPGPRRPLVDPPAQGVHLLAGKRLVLSGISGGSRRDHLEKKALVGLARGNRRPGFAAFEQPRAGRQREAPFGSSPRRGNGRNVSRRVARLDREIVGRHHHHHHCRRLPPARSIKMRARSRSAASWRALHLGTMFDYQHVHEIYQTSSLPASAGVLAIRSSSSCRKRLDWARASRELAGTPCEFQFLVGRRRRKARAFVRVLRDGRRRRNLPRRA